MARAISPLSRSSTSIEMRGCSARKAASAFGRYSEMPEVLASRCTLARAPLAKDGEIAVQRFDIVQDDAGVIEQAFAGRGQLHAAAAALEQRDAERSFQALDPLAGRGQRQVHARSARGDAAGLRDRDEELEIDQIETHGQLDLRHLAFVMAEGILRKVQIVPVAAIGQCALMRNLLADPHRRGLPDRRIRQGRDRAWAADGVDGPARGDHAAGPGDRDRHRAGDRHQHLADLWRALSARHHPPAVAADDRHGDRHLAQRAGCSPGPTRPTAP